MSCVPEESSTGHEAISVTDCNIPHAEAGNSEREGDFVLGTVIIKLLYVPSVMRRFGLFSVLKSLLRYNCEAWDIL